MILINALLATVLLFAPEDSLLEQASISAYAVDMRTGGIVVDQDSHKSLVPASSLKLVTTAAALQLLGPEFRFHTDLEYDGRIDAQGVLHGNLYIHGGGDPCLGSGRIASGLSWHAQAEAWAEAVSKCGIRSVEGNVVGDASAWEEALAVPSWNWEDIGNYYGAGASALTFCENAYTLILKPGKAVGEETVVIGTEPPLSGVAIHNAVKTGPVGSGDQACIYGAEFSLSQVVRGTIPAGVDTFSIRGAIPNPPLFCAEALIAALRSRGIAVQSKLCAPSNRIVFHTTLSPTLKEIVYATNQLSHNLFAEHLLKQMGGGSTNAGCAAVKAFWHEQKINLQGFNMADGSGLSRKNLITAKQLVEMLSAMKRSHHFAAFFESLPEEFPGVRAKSGSMAFIRAYAGYAGDIAFAVIVNQCQDLEIKFKLQQFLSSLMKDHPSAEENPGTPSNR